MRMKYIYHLLKENYKYLEQFSIYSETYRVNNIGNSRGRIDNWNDARNALLHISSIPFLTENCSMFLDNPFLAKSDDSFFIPHETYLELSSKHEELLMQIQTIINFYEAVGYNTTEMGFDVKMPPTNDFSEFAKNIGLLDKAINQCPFLNIDNEKIILKKTDVGSIWFEFVVAATATSFILMNFAKIVDKCIKIKSHLITVKQQEENLRQLELKNDTLEIVIDANKQITNALVEKCIDELQKDITDINLEKDDRERVRYSLETISNLMEKGLEIYVSIDAPQEVKDLFPTSDEISALPKPPELLSETTNIDYV